MELSCRVAAKSFPVIAARLAIVRALVCGANGLIYKPKNGSPASQKETKITKGEVIMERGGVRGAFGPPGTDELGAFVYELRALIYGRDA